MENRYIYGMHEPPPMAWLVEHMTLEGEAAGWIVHTHEVGHDPDARGGFDYSPWANVGWGQIARLNNGYGEQGTIPLDPWQYDAFARRCAHWVESSRGCRHWIVGNEPNSSMEGLISAELYADCFRQVYTAIHAVQPEAVVMPAPVAMWNAEAWDWIAYYRDLMTLCAPFDAICWHTYTHGSEPELIRSMQTMGPPYEERLYHFRAYWDLWDATPATLWDKPVFITETDQSDVGGVRQPWLNEPGVSWVQEAYAEIDEFNRGHGSPIRCLALYRWPKYDEWFIQGKGWVHLDVQDAVKHGYAWRAGEAPELPEGESVINPSFEQPYEKQAGTAFVAAGWKYWYNEGDPPAETSQGPLAMPEYKEAPKAIDARRVSEGLSAQCWFIQYKVMDGGVRQLVPVTPGRRYRFTVDAQTWCSSSDTPTADDGEMYVSLGLDPLGRTDAKALGVVWSPWQRATNQHVAYQSQVVEATGPAMTVYVRAWNKWRLKHNDIYVDNVRWLEEGAPEIPEPPTPGECQALSAEQVEEIVRRVVREEIRGIQLQIALTCAGG